jgi:hypothetical protein
MSITLVESELSKYDKAHSFDVIFPFIAHVKISGHICLRLLLVSK